jgi:hypothetical protein
MQDKLVQATYNKPGELTQNKLYRVYSVTRVGKYNRVAYTIINDKDVLRTYLANKFRATATTELDKQNNIEILDI